MTFGLTCHRCGNEVDLLPSTERGPAAVCTYCAISWPLDVDSQKQLLDRVVRAAVRNAISVSPEERAAVLEQALRDLGFQARVMAGGG